MNRYALVAALTIPALCIGMAVSASSPASLAAPPAAQAPAQVLPPGFPRTPEQMTKLLQASAGDKRRDDAWNFFAELTATGKPQWETEQWDTKCKLDLTPSSGDCRSYGALQTPNDSSRARPVSTIFYNHDAAHAIQSGDLANGQSLLKLIRAGYAGIPDTQFPRSSIVIKEIWEGFNNGVGLPQEIKVFNQNIPTSDGQLPPITDWNNTIVLNMDPNAPCKPQDYAAKESQKPDPVPLNCFYSISSLKTPCSTIVAFATVTQIQGPSLLSTSPCTLVLVGIQIITKEVSQWTWNTFWWTNAYRGPKTEGKPSTLSDPFSHFAMDTMIGSDNPAATPIFNPYLEGPQTNGANSNCLQCHSRAAFTPNCLEQICQRSASTRIGITNPEKGASSSKPLHTCKPGEIAGTNDPCQLQTGFLWSIATNQDVSSTESPLRSPVRPKRPQQRK